MQANPVEAALIPGVNGAGYLEDGAYFIERDHHSNIIAITDDQGGQLTNIAYTPYGEIDQANSWAKISTVSSLMGISLIISVKIP